MKARAVSLMLAGWWVTSSAQAAPCGRPDVDFTLPTASAGAVPPNAQLSAHYASPARYLGEPVSLRHEAGHELPLLANYDPAESLLHATPQRPLDSGSYDLVWPGLLGVSGAGVGRGSSISFFVEGEPDLQAPSFDGLVGLRWDLARDQDPCVDGLQDRFVFELELGAANDDRGSDLLLVRVFQTRGPEAQSDAPVAVALRAHPGAGRLELRRPAHRAGTTCFAAVVQDLAGQVSGGGESEVCVTTTEAPFFEGCSVTSAAHAPRRPRHALTSLGWLCGLIFYWRRLLARNRQHQGAR
jgi:hypothetical protein